MIRLNTVIFQLARWQVSCPEELIQMLPVHPSFSLLLLALLHFCCYCLGDYDDDG